jgi:integrase
MPSPKQTYCFLTLFEKFIRDSKSGRRLQPNGKPVKKGTTNNYYYTLLVLKSFIANKNFDLRIRSVRRLGNRELNAERNYWKKFYRKFTDYLYNDCAYFDNYVGLTIKNIRTFFNYLNKELSMGVGDFHKVFYVRKEEIAIFPLMPEELHFLINDKDFEDGLTKRMKEVKDFFVFGCTVALRFSDLVMLKKSNLREVNGQCYLAVKSAKTSIDSLIKLPTYAVDIVHRHQKLQRRLLPKFNIVNLNKFIKILLEKAGFTQPVHISRNRRGVAVTKKSITSDVNQVRFCDEATTHSMRRTAITTMLSQSSW